MDDAKAGLGLLLLAVGVVATYAHHVWYFMRFEVTLLQFTASFVPPGLVLGTTVAVVGYVRQSAIDDAHLARIATWYLLGGLALGTAAYVSLQGSLAGDVPFAALRLSVANWAIGGSFIGLLLGFYDGRRSQAVGEATARQREASRQARRLSVLNRILRHDIRNKITVIQGHAKLLEASDPEGSPSAIQQAARELLEIADRVRKLHTVTQEQSRQPVDLTACVDHAVAAMGNQYPEAQLTTDVDEDASAFSYPDIEDVIYDLVENAVVHNDNDEPDIVVDIALRRVAGADAGYCELLIEDNGPGMPAFEEVTLQEEGETQLAHSLGTGLWLARWVVEESDGAFDFTSGTDGGTLVQIRLPTPP